mmetsp:Transcript_9762/g.17322  ORF Transcript_9762/g.17322 Transcript_9762/m.17322 type:complete len:376 (-) Transcript_9762:131-1258(-)
METPCPVFSRFSRRHRQFLMLVAAIVVILQLRPFLWDNQLWANGSADMRMCAETNRCRTLERDRRFSFVHISKSGGASWIGELKATGVGALYPEEAAGPEHSVVYQVRNAHQYDHLSYHLTSLRSPRHHTWSLWAECRWDPWGKRTTKKTGFPNSGTDIEGDLKDFTEWIGHFVDEKNHTIYEGRISNDGSYRCYHPANYQSRALTVQAGNPHMPDSAADIFPDTTIARQTYDFMDWVAITEFYHESKCLLYHRMEPNSPSMQEYVDRTCHCRPDNIAAGADVATTDVNVQHYKGRRRKTLWDLPESLLASIADLTSIDVVIYRAALAQFMAEIRWMEAEVGHRVFCESVLEKWEHEFEYLNLSVSELYHYGTYP